MKRVVLVGDGMGDYPCKELGNRTPLQAAHIPAMRRIAARGTIHAISTIAEGLPPGSDVCNMGLLGYNAQEQYTGRAPIEAAGAGIAMHPDDVAFRCNLVTIRDGRMIDYSAGHISSEEGDCLIRALAKELEQEGMVFHPGVSYRHLLLWRKGPDAISSEPPHEIAGREVEPYLPQGPGAADVRALMEKSKAILADHPVNRARREAGQEMATQLWLWGQGKALQIPSFRERHGLTGGVVTAVDLVRGLGRLTGLEVPTIEGATGFIDTNYEGKVAAAQTLLQQHDFAYVHIEAPDECGHMGDAQLKTKAIEDFDARVVGPLWHYLEGTGVPYRLMVAMDHRTPIVCRGHTTDPVPLAVLDGPVGDVYTEAAFDETTIETATVVKAYELMSRLFAR